MPNRKNTETLPVIAEKPHMITPLVPVDEALLLLEQYEKLKANIVRPEDVQKIQGKDFLKKSYWRRLAKCFGISLSLEKEWKETNEDGTTTFYATIIATAPNGQSCMGDGACNTGEKGLEKTDHNTRAIAITRAKNRAISDLVGGGEVSAEEINHTESEEKGKPEYITMPQRKRMFAIAKSKKYTNDEIKAHLKINYGIDHTEKVQREWYEQICEDFQTGKALRGEVE